MLEDVPIPSRNLCAYRETNPRSSCDPRSCDRACTPFSLCSLTATMMRRVGEEELGERRRKRKWGRRLLFVPSPVRDDSSAVAASRGGE